MRESDVYNYNSTIYDNKQYDDDKYSYKTLEGQEVKNFTCISLYLQPLLLVNMSRRMSGLHICNLEYR